MPRPNPVPATGTLLRRTGERTWVTSLPNGATTLAHVPTWKLADMPDFAAGDTVRLEMTQYDFSIARIAGNADPSAEPAHSSRPAPEPVELPLR